MSFTPVVQGDLTYFTAPNITATHCFTSRLGGVSKGHLASMNIGGHRGDEPALVEENYRILGNALGFSPAQLVLTRQTHSDIVRAVTAEDAGKGLNHDAYPECDALVTNTPGVALVVFTADCTPVLLHDPVTGAVGAVHAGWRGTAAGIVAKTVDAMVSCYGCDPKNIRAAIGPNISQCCFETDADVPTAMMDALGDAAMPYIQQRADKYYVNLKEMNALWLRKTGVCDISISSLCTACRQDLFWSHRHTGNLRGSQGAVILCKERIL